MNDQRRALFELVRLNTSPYVIPIVDQLERMMEVDVLLIEVRDTQLAIKDGMLDARVTMAGREDD